MKGRKPERPGPGGRGVQQSAVPTDLNREQLLKAVKQAPTSLLIDHGISGEHATLPELDKAIDHIHPALQRQDIPIRPERLAAPSEPESHAAAE